MPTRQGKISLGADEDGNDGEQYEKCRYFYSANHISELSGLHSLFSFLFAGYLILLYHKRTAYTSSGVLHIKGLKAAPPQGNGAATEQPKGRKRRGKPFRPSRNIAPPQGKGAATEQPKAVERERKNARLYELTIRVKEVDIV